MSKKKVLAAATLATLGLVALTATSSSVGRHGADRQQLAAPNASYDPDLSYLWGWTTFDTADQIAPGVSSPAPRQQAPQPAKAAPAANQDRLSSSQKWFFAAGSSEAP